jgi:hypothetical protein
VRRRRAIAIALSTLLLGGCFTGQRPHFTDTTAPFHGSATTGDVNIDAVLALLDKVTAGPATAAYTVLTKFGNTSHPAMVVLAPGKRSITVGNVHYIQTISASATCTEDKSVPCASGFLPQRISDVGITVDFYAADAAKRLRRDALAKTGPSVAQTATIAQQQATCVQVPLGAGTAVYCALQSGLIAKLDDGDVLITLTLYGAVADDGRFVIPSS